MPLQPQQDISRPFTTGIYNVRPALENREFVAQFGINTALPHDHSLRSKARCQASFDRAERVLNQWRGWCAEHGHDPDDPTNPDVFQQTQKYREVMDFWQAVLRDGRWEIFDSER